MKINIQQLNGYYYLTATLPDGRLRYSTGIKVGTKSAEYAIGQVKATAERIVNTTETSASELRRRLNESRGIIESSGVDLVTFAQEWLDGYARTHPYNTVKTFEATISHLKRIGSVDLCKLNEDFFTDVVEWYQGEGYLRNYTAKMVSNFRRIAREARKRGLWNGDPSGWRYGAEMVNNIYLTTEELKRIESVTLNERLSNARDQFLIGCYTGLRYSDFIRLEPDQAGEMLVMDTQKTGGRVYLPIHPVVRRLMGRKLRPISNQNLNTYLKEIGEKACIDEVVYSTRTEGNRKVTHKHLKWELITTHTARRSFATNLYIAGVRSEDIQRLTGHSSHRQLMQYIKLDSETTARVLANHPFFNEDGPVSQP